jgi:hypothetical protein
MNGIIPELHLTTLQKYIDRSAMPESAVMANKFSTSQYPSDTIEWEVSYGSTAMIPNVARGARGPSIGIDGTAMNSAKAAYFNMNAFLGEEFLNNLRRPGTDREKAQGQIYIARQQRKLLSAAQRRREWSVGKMLFEGQLSMTTYNGSQSVGFQSVDYGIPDTNKVTLTDAKRWAGGADKDIFQDMRDLKERFRFALGTDQGMEVWLNSLDLFSMISDSTVRDLLKTNNVSDAQLNNSPEQAIATILGVGSVNVYDGTYEVESMLAATYAGGTAVFVVNPADFEVGGNLFLRTGETTAYVRAKITAVNLSTGEITLANALTGAFGKALEHKAVMQKYVLTPGKAVAMMPSVNGMSIAEIMEAPYGLPEHYGPRLRAFAKEDPDGYKMVIEDLFLPVLYFPEAIQYISNITAGI